MIILIRVDQGEETEKADEHDGRQHQNVEVIDDIFVVMMMMQVDDDVDDANDTDMPTQGLPPFAITISVATPEHIHQSLFCLICNNNIL